VTALKSGLQAWPWFWLAGWLTAGFKLNLVLVLMLGLKVGLVDGLGYALWGTFTEGIQDSVAADADSYSSLDPIASWNSSRSYGLVVGLIAGLIVGLVAGLVLGHGGALVLGLRDALGWGLVAGLVTGLAAAKPWAVSLASIRLTIRWGTPVRLMKFLDDALNRNVLRAVGPTYQFRHARLQERLDPATGINGTFGSPSR
jgi:hypothetical protein